jgi:hypothetical protein
MKHSPDKSVLNILTSGIQIQNLHGIWDLLIPNGKIGIQLLI